MKVTSMCMLIFGLGLLVHAQSHPDIPTVSVVEAPSPATVSGFLESPTRLLTYAYRNDDSRAIIGYKHVCIVATNDGRTGWSASERLALFSGTRPFKQGDEQRRAGHILPGEKIEVHNGLQGNREFPFGIQSCGLVAVTFEDRSDVGAPAIIKDIRAKRRVGVKDFDGPQADQAMTYSSPVIISLDDSRPRLTDLENGVEFDLDADGQRERVSWTAEGTEEAFLTIDRNQNGLVDDGTEFLGHHSPQLPSSQANGFRALAVFDDPLNGGNADGWIDSSDPVYEHLSLWVDSNHDGLSQPGELKGLAERGVEAVGVVYTRSERRDPHGNLLRYRSQVRTTAQTASHTAWDVFFQISPTN